MYQGRLIIRFDDTNSTEEKVEYEHSIKENLLMLGINSSVVSYTSDFFDQTYEYAIKLIKEGKAYYACRAYGRYRDLAVAENLHRFEEMKNAEFGQICCLRAKNSIDNPNKALRDSVIYRCNLIPHARTGRLNFVYSVVKGKLTWFVDRGRVQGWDDPRFPTVRGIRRRGLTMEALKTYILMQGASTNFITLEWDKLWAVNRKHIDPISPIYTAVESLNKVKVTMSKADAYNLKEVPRHKKNEDLGNKKTAYGPTIWLDQADCKELELNEEVTLMDWGNTFIRSIEKNSEGVVISVQAELHLEGDFKKTKKKLTWLADGPELVKVDLMDYDYLITKKKVEEDDDLMDLLTPVSEFKTEAIADGNVASRHYPV
ncbi:hypothetical protein BGZ65_004098 [Modicella reniformis]|uniref:Glutamyl-tRNA synthetase n=1 Tax=Modicella reniformis TaxID=1440133 RepID=A0A9P6SQ28_9FUNG|nr:hypothetical protein BGZ65_004098 [Modicella reniformis]